MSLNLDTRRWLARSSDVSDDVATLMLKHFAVTPATATPSVEPQAARWHKNCTDLTLVIQKHGSLPRHDRQNAQQHKLARWLGNQVRAFKNRSLSDERVGALMKVGTPVRKLLEEEARKAEENPQRSGLKWDERFEQVADFINDRGGPPSRRSAESAEKLLGSWLDNQYKSNAKGRLPQHRISQLVALHPNIGKRLSSKPVQDQQWQERLVQLTEHLAVYGTIPASGETTPCIYTWIAKQRAQFGDGELSQDRTDRLVALGDAVQAFLSSGSQFFPGAPRPANQVRFIENLRSVEQFVAANGVLPTGKAANPADRRLGFWINNYRNKSRGGGLNDWQVEVLSGAHPLVLKKFGLLN